MRYAVEARYINGQPELRTLDADSGITCLEWSLAKVQKMLDTGEISQEGFLQPIRYGMDLLVKNLFLLSCVETLEQRTMRSLSFTIDFSPKHRHQRKRPGFHIQPK